jgi:hypothetical protein
MTELMVCLQRILLPGASMIIDFAWMTCPESYGTCTRLNTVPPSVCISLNCNATRTILPTCSRLGPLAQGRLSTLLRELVHAYLSVYACKRCQSSKDAVERMDEHGKAWQQGASWIEKAALHGLGLPTRSREIESSLYTLA